jgi:hypothetical protein
VQDLPKHAGVAGDFILPSIDSFQERLLQQATAAAEVLSSSIHYQVKLHHQLQEITLKRHLQEPSFSS